MKAYLFGLIYFWAFMTFAQPSFLLSGKIKALGAENISVYEVANENKILLAGKTKAINDSFQVSVKCLQSNLVYVDLGKQRKTHLFFVHQEKNLQLVGELSQLEKMEIQPLTSQQLYQTYLLLADKITQLREDYAKSVIEAGSDEAKKEQLHTSFLLQREQILGEMADFIQKNKSEMVALHALYTHFLYERDVRKLENLFGSLNVTNPNLFYVSRIKQTIEHESTTKYGMQVPDFTLYNADSQEVKLSDYKGKYVLLEFWASWCRPCRVEIPKLEELYLEKKKIPFEIISISTDKDIRLWKNALSQEKTNYTQVQDSQNPALSLVKKYKIGIIPANLLLDDKGVIIGKNLTIGEIRAILKG